MCAWPFARVHLICSIHLYLCLFLFHSCICACSSSADSVTWNPHKLMGTLLQCSTIHFKEDVSIPSIFIQFVRIHRENHTCRWCIHHQSSSSPFGYGVNNRLHCITVFHFWAHHKCFWSHANRAICCCRWIFPWNSTLGLSNGATLAHTLHNPEKLLIAFKCFTHKNTFYRFTIKYSAVESRLMLVDGWQVAN